MSSRIEGLRNKIGTLIACIFSYPFTRFCSDLVIVNDLLDYVFGRARADACVVSKMYQALRKFSAKRRKTGNFSSEFRCLEVEIYLWVLFIKLLLSIKSEISQRYCERRDCCSAAA